MQLKVILLGTASAMPTYERGLSCAAIVRGSEVLIFDAGEGMQRNFLQSSIGINRKTKIFITHMHSDHCVGLLGLLQTMSLQNRDIQLQLYGPECVNDFIFSNMRVLDFGLTFPLSISSVREGLVVKEKDYLVKAITAKHSVNSYSYCMQEYERPGIFYPENAKALGIPKGNLWHKLQHGTDVEYNGKIVSSKEVTGPQRKGRKIGISGDTRPDDKLIEFFRDCDLLIFDSTYGENHKENATKNMHSTAKEAATLAVKANVKKLVLTHFSARYKDIQILVREALEIHPRVVVAEDLLTIEIPYEQ